VEHGQEIAQVLSVNLSGLIAPFTDEVGDHLPLKFGAPSPVRRTMKEVVEEHQRVSFGFERIEPKLLTGERWSVSPTKQLAQH